MSEVVCPRCEILWNQIRRDEDEVAKMRKHPLVYGNTIKELKADLERRYAKARECRKKNHPEAMY